MESEDEAVIHSNHECDEDSTINSTSTKETRELQAVFPFPQEVTQGSSGFVFGNGRFLKRPALNGSLDASPSEASESASLGNVSNSENAQSASDEQNTYAIDINSTNFVEGVFSSSSIPQKVPSVDDNSQPLPIFDRCDCNSSDSFKEECDLLYDTLWPNGEPNDESLEDLGSKFSLSDFLDESVSHAWLNQQDSANDSPQSIDSSENYKSCSGSENGNRGSSPTPGSINEIPPEDQRKSECEDLSSGIKTMQHHKAFGLLSSDIDCSSLNAEGSLSPMYSPKTSENNEDYVSPNQSPRTPSPSYPGDIFNPYKTIEEDYKRTTEQTASSSTDIAYETHDDERDFDAEIDESNKTSCSSLSYGTSTDSCLSESYKVSDESGTEWTSKSKYILCPLPTDQITESAHHEDIDSRGLQNASKETVPVQSTSDEENQARPSMSFKTRLIDETCREVSNTEIRDISWFNAECQSKKRSPADCRSNIINNRDTYQVSILEKHGNEETKLSDRYYVNSNEFSSCKNDNVDRKNQVRLSRAPVLVFSRHNVSNAINNLKNGNLVNASEYGPSVNPSKKLKIDSDSTSINSRRAPATLISPCALPTSSLSRYSVTNSNFPSLFSESKEGSSVEKTTDANKLGISSSGNNTSCFNVSVTKTDHDSASESKSCSSVTSRYIPFSIFSDAPFSQNTRPTHEHSQVQETKDELLAVTDQDDINKGQQYILTLDRARDFKDKIPKRDPEQIINERSFSVTMSQGAESVTRDNLCDVLTYTFSMDMPSVLTRSSNSSAKPTLCSSGNVPNVSGHESQFSDRSDRTDISTNVSEVDGTQIIAQPSTSTESGIKSILIMETDKGNSQIEVLSCSGPSTSDATSISVSQNQDTNAASNPRILSPDGTLNIAQLSASTESDVRNIPRLEIDKDNPQITVLSRSGPSTPKATSVSVSQNQNTNAVSYPKFLSPDTLTDAPVVSDSEHTHQNINPPVTRSKRRRERSANVLPTKPEQSIIQNIPSTSSQGYRQKLRHCKHQTVCSEPSSSEAASAIGKKRKRTETEPVVYMTRAKMRKMMQESVLNAFKLKKKSFRK